MRRSIRQRIDEVRLRAAEKAELPYIIEPTGRGRTKCHVDAPDPDCPRCRRRLLMRHLRKKRREAKLSNNATPV